MKTAYQPKKFPRMTQFGVNQYFSRGYTVEFDVAPRGITYIGDYYLNLTGEVFPKSLIPKTCIRIGSDLAKTQKVLLKRTVNPC